MTSSKGTSITKKYKKNSAYIRIEATIRNPETAKQTPLHLECRIDTGFDGGIFVPSLYLSDAKMIGIEPGITNITLADGGRITAYVCTAHINKIEKHYLPEPGKPVILVICGNRKGQLLGMDTLKYCTTAFDGPKQCFTITI